MRIVHVLAECDPLIKVGGLAEAVPGLSHALSEKNVQVELVIPKYSSLDLSKVKNLRQVKEISCHFAGKQCNNRIWQAKLNKLDITMVEPLAPIDFFQHPDVYGYPDDPLRFAYFSLVALEYLISLSDPFDVVHVHDWHTGLLPLLYKEQKQKRSLPDLHFILTIHNLSYLGNCERDLFVKVGIGSTKAEALRLEGTYSLLKAGILHADILTTVSPTYSKEILTPEMGGSLYQTLLSRKELLHGILNGLDTNYWNPSNDPFLPFHYSWPNLKNKAKIKEFVAKKLSVKITDQPLVCAITRLVYQKGPELIIEAATTTLQKGGSFILIGSSPDPKIKMEFKALQHQYSSDSSLHLELSFHEELAHLVYAASDLFVMPSLFEPCGLSQMIAMHYGTVPLVRATGGLRDTVFHEKNGFLFYPPTNQALQGALDEAFNVWNQKPEVWHKMVELSMTKDFSWKESAEKYLSLYKSIQSTHRVPS